MSFHTLEMVDINTFTSSCELRRKEIVLLWVEKEKLKYSLYFAKYHPPGLFYSDFPSVMHAFQSRPWPTCAGRLNITAL